MPSQRLLLFGDQMLENLPIIRSLVHRSRKSALLQRFLQQATDVIQFEVSKLDRYEQESFFDFETLLSLAEKNARLRRPNEIVNTTLITIARLSHLILFAEQDPTILGSSESTIHVGLCTGLLPAAVAVLATDTGQLLRYGLEIVAISFRLTHEIILRSRRVETEPGSWSYTVVGIHQEQAQSILDDYNHDLPSHRHAYISTFSSTWCTISGPPTVLTRLWQSSTPIGQAPRLELPADAAVHSTHLPCLDVDKIFASSAMFLTTPLCAKVRILSPHNGEPYSFSKCRDLLLAIIQDISHNHMDLIQTFRKAASGFRGVRNVHLMVIGPTAHASSVQTALEENRLNVNVANSTEDLVPHMSTRDGSGLVAVVGMSGRFPGSESIQEFWESLQLGRDFHSEIPKSRFDVEEHFDASGNGKNTILTPFGCFLDRPGMFDNHLFNVSPREAIQMDPLQRLILMTSYEALEMAGYGQHSSPSSASKRVSTYIGQVTDDWRIGAVRHGIDIYYIPGTARAFTSGRINFHFKWEGASYNLDTACASSSTAISLACSALLARDCDTAVAGGGTILAASNDYSGLSKGGFLSPTGNCKTFQDSADGYCRGEGIGVVVLKRLEDAIAENDNIQAVISGWGRTHSAKATSITQPHAETQATLYRKILEQACTSPQGIGYVEMHGTGTQVGDSIEMESVINVFGEGRRKDNPLVVGAVKANVGHGEAAAGVTSLIKTIMMLRQKSIPPQPGAPFETNHLYPPLSKMNIRIADQCIPFKPPLGGDGKRRLLLNNFDASGGNTCLIIEDPPPLQARNVRDPRSYHIVVCSARTSGSLCGNQRRLFDFIKAHPKTKLSDLSYTTTARRLHHVIRRSYCVSTLEDLVQQLGADLSNPAVLAKPLKTTPLSVFTFTGQGSIYPGMGKQMVESCSRFKNSLFAYQQICDSHGLPQVLDIFTDPDIDIKLKSTVQIQLAITFLEVAMADLLMSWGIRPSLLIGHSLGEFAAMCVSGVLSLADTFYLVGRRSALLEQRCKSGAYAMLAVGASVEQLEPLLSTAQFKSCQIACINTPNKTVISGPIDSLHKFRDQLQSTRVRTTFLEITYGFHSSQVESILYDFESSAKALNFAHPEIPVASTLMAGTIVKEKGIFSPAYLARQAREPVNFAGTLQACAEAGLINASTVWFEIGPEPVNLSLVRDTLNIKPESLLPTLKSREDNWKTVSQAVSAAYMSGITPDWSEYHKEYSNALSLLDLPFYAFDLKEYWPSYSKIPVSDTPLEAKVPTEPISGSFVPSTTLQHLQHFSEFQNETSAVFSSFLSEPMLLAAIKGHRVDGTAICPASVFCDMALAAAVYLFTSSNPKENISAMVLEGLEITHPLIASDKDVLQKTVEVKASITHVSKLVEIQFGSRNSGSSSLHEHGSCAVRLGEAVKLQGNHHGSSKEAKTKLDLLIESAKTGQQLRLPKMMVYKLFASLVQYDTAYQSMDEVYLDNSHKDAAASVRLTTKPNVGTFTCNPYWIDAVTHLSGFLLNGNVAKPNNIAYISTGFKELFIFDALRPNTEYAVFSSIQDEDKKGVSLGHIYVFQEQRLVAMCSEISFQKMTKSTLDIIMGKSDPAGSSVGLASTAATSVSNESASQIAQTVLAAVASETGYNIDDLQPTTSFADIGVDSLMSIAIVSAVKRMVGVELPGSFFQNHPTVADVTNELTPDESSGTPSALHTPPSSMYKDDDLKQAPHTPTLFDKFHSSPTAKNDENLSDPVTIDPALKKTLHAPSNMSAFHSPCVLVQGRSTSKATPLFLIADGAGSAAAYIHLPPLSDRKIYALESPFFGDPSKFTCSIEEVAGIYLTALRKAQPRGPYILGGWSVGAIYAYELSRQLLNQGETILGLILIDMRIGKPMPVGVQPTMELVEEMGLLVGLTRAGQAASTVSKLTKQHFLETVKAQMLYEPIAMDPVRRPNYTCLIWAKKGLIERERSGKEQEPAGLEENPRHLGKVVEGLNTGIRSWLNAKRTNFGPHGWEKLVGDLDIHTIDGDHFSIVTPPYVKVLGHALQNAMEKSVINDMTQPQKVDRLLADADTSTEGALVDVLSDFLGQSPANLPREKAIPELLDSISIMSFIDEIRNRLHKVVGMKDVQEASSVIALAKKIDSEGELEGIAEAGPPKTFCINDESDDQFLKMQHQVQPVLEKFGLTWADDVQDVYPMADSASLVWSRMMPISSQLTYLTKVSDKDQLRSIIASSLKAWPTFRCLCAEYDPETHLWIVLKNNKKFLDIAISEHPDVESPIELATLNITPRHAAGQFPDSPLFRAVVANVRSTGTAGFVMRANHTAFDNRSMTYWHEDLKLLLKGEPAIQRPPYKLFADSYYLYQHSLPAQQSTAFHLRLLNGLSNLRQALWPPRDTSFVLPDTASSDETAIDRRTPQMPISNPRVKLIHYLRVPTMPTIASYHGISAPVLVRTAIALFNTFQTGQSHAIFAMIMSGRAWPFLSPEIINTLPNPLNVAGPTMSSVTSVLKIDFEESIDGLLRRVAQQSKQLDKHQHYPKSMPAQLNKGDREVWMEAKGQSWNWAPTRWDDEGEQRSGLELVRGDVYTGYESKIFMWRCGMRDKQTIRVGAEWNRTIIPEEQVEGFLVVVMRIIELLGQVDQWGKKVGEVRDAAMLGHV